MPRPLELDVRQWPQPCTGNCGRMLRPAHTKMKDWPNTQASVLVTDPWCAPCRLKAQGRNADFAKREKLSPEQEAARIERIRADLDALMRDRRARGIPPEGLYVPGDEEREQEAKRKHDTAKQNRAVQFSEEAPLGYCARGHKFDRIDPAGRRKCDTCAADILERNRQRRVTRDTGKAHGKCRRGHEYTSVKGNKRYCPECKALSRERVMERRARDTA